jgi:3-deoxy-7-phosphoheptulonate synthase
MERLENRNLIEFVPLVPPCEVKAERPVPEDVGPQVAGAREAVRRVIQGQDPDRMIAIVGPCSIHDPNAAYDYATRLRVVAEDVDDSLLVVMRTYFEKPRTTIGWKGLINDPHLDGSCDLSHGLALAREILIEIWKQGVPCATEFLDPVTPQYIADLICWAAIGARTTESQTHREMASGLSMPVGFKNGTDGGLEIARDAMISASHPHSFVGINDEGVTSVVRTLGNPDRHAVLRGGKRGPNYFPDDIERAVALLSKEGIDRPVMVDCSHDQTLKNSKRQPSVCREVVRQFVQGQNAIAGVMIESNLHSGNQKWKRGAPLEYGVSLTDACLGWEETEDLLQKMAGAVRRARSSAAEPSV